MSQLPVDYLYIDEKRTLSYFDQLFSNTALQKVPEWTVGLSLMGPSVKGTQRQVSRAYSLHEKIQRLTDALEERGQLRRSLPTSTDDDVWRSLCAGMSSWQGVRVSPEWSDTPFILEELDAKRCEVPRTNDLQREFPPLRFWMASSPSLEQRAPRHVVRSLRYLLEDYSESDERPVNISRVDFGSMYTTLFNFFCTFQSDISRSILGDYALYREGHEPGLSRYIRDNSVVITPSRRVRVLYRIRRVLVGCAHAGLDVHAYPIYIASMPSVR